MRSWINFYVIGTAAAYVCKGNMWATIITGVIVVYYFMPSGSASASPEPVRQLNNSTDPSAERKTS